MWKYLKMTSGILRINEQSENVVRLHQPCGGETAVRGKFRPLPVREQTEKLFPTSKVLEDVAAVYAMFGLRPFNPILRRKAMGSGAYSNVSESKGKS